jgi:hypothetical protein
MNSHTGLHARVHDYEQQQQREQDEDAPRISDINEDHTTPDPIEALAETAIDTDVEEEDDDGVIESELAPKVTNKSYNGFDDMSQLLIL